jgi:hypothetical protein
MGTQRELRSAATISNANVQRPGLMSRWLGAWRRLEDAIALSDYGLYDHVADRVGALEARVAELEARATALERRSARDE